jgi:hypothetical protein
MYFAPRIGFFNMDSNGGLWDAVFYVMILLFCCKGDLHNVPLNGMFCVHSGHTD